MEAVIGSNNPTWQIESNSRQADAGGLGWICPVAIIAAILYGSLIPFDFAFSVATVPDGFGMLTPGLGSAGLEDIITNLLVYVPIGLTVALSSLCSRLSKPARVVIAILIGATVSIAIETLQTGIASRVASWLDMFANSAGAAIGAIAGVTLYKAARSRGARLRARLTERPFLTLASVLALGLFIYKLAPFDFITDTAGLRASFLRAVWAMPAVGSTVPGVPPYEAMIEQLFAAVWFAGLGYLFALGERESGHRPHVAIALAIQQGCVIVVTSELMQLFTVSNVFEIPAIVLGVLAILLGAWLAIFVVDGQIGSAWKMEPESALGGQDRLSATPTLLLVMLVLLQAGAMLAASIDPHLLALGGLDFARIKWMPFQALWRGPMLDAAFEILSVLIVYGILAAMLAVILRRARVRRMWLVTGAAVIALALALEGIQSATVTQSADMTVPVLALVAVGLVARLHSSPRLRIPLPESLRG
jgi:glycopeptide antibiotics resistance protein